METKIISLDIETYGAIEEGIRGNPLPKQTVFHPARSIHTDGIDLKDLIITASITLVKDDQCETQNELWKQPYSKHTQLKTRTQETSLLPKSTSQVLSSLQLKNLKPQETMVFDLSNHTEKLRLKKWLEYSEVIIGMNLPFDIQYLRKDPFLKFTLENQLLIDLSVINYLHDETRQEKSLKSLGPILRTHAYENTLKDKRFKSPTDPKLKEYNAQDTHNTVLAVRELARRIEQDFPSGDKLSPFCIEFYSNLLWTIIRMSESGICMNKKKLEKFEVELLTLCEEANETATEAGYPLQGEGSGTAKQQLMDDAIDLIGDWMRDEMELTPAKGLVSFTEANRNKLQNALKGPAAIRGMDDELIMVFDAAKKHAGAQKIISSYTYPLLRHRRNKPTDQSSCLIPVNGHHVAYPTWYATPTYAKNAEGGSGGTLQGRITCKKPSAQTFPSSIKDRMCSRFKGGKIVSMDLSQIELRVAGLLSGDKAFIDAYQNGEDLHEQRARQCFDDVDENFHARRQAAKMINFADLFRAGAVTMQKQLLAMTGIEFKLVFLQKIVGFRKKHRPKLWAFQKELINEASTTGRVELPFTGQSRYFLGGDKYEINEIVNFPVQTTASNTLLSIQSYIHNGMASINSPNPSFHMFLNIYDAIYFDVKDEEAEDNLKYLVEEAVKHVQDEGYWSMISKYYGNKIPLEYDWS
tara:strand:+ start:23251 stop:25332 length:2082 start_codon:yes stop_codon:yes gene_type:complete